MRIATTTTVVPKDLHPWVRRGTTKKANGGANDDTNQKFRPSWETKSSP